jgi:hypothetical protein
MAHHSCLSNVKLLRLGIYDNICGPEEVEYIDQVCREIEIDRGCSKADPVLVQKESIGDITKTETESEEKKPEANENLLKIKKKINVISSFSYLDSPETILSSLQVSAKVFHAANLDANSKQNRLEVPPGVPNEIAQMQRLTRISAWRKATMQKLNQKIKSGTIK